MRKITDMQEKIQGARDNEKSKAKLKANRRRRKKYI